jgi:hypothetical protein
VRRLRLRRGRRRYRRWRGGFHQYRARDRERRFGAGRISRIQREMAGPPACAAGRQAQGGAKQRHVTSHSETLRVRVRPFATRVHFQRPGVGSPGKHTSTGAGSDPKDEGGRLERRTYHHGNWGIGGQRDGRVVSGHGWSGGHPTASGDGALDGLVLSRGAAATGFRAAQRGRCIRSARMLHTGRVGSRGGAAMRGSGGGLAQTGNNELQDEDERHRPK